MMSSTQETVALLREELGGELESLRVERVVVGIFFTGLKLSSGRAGIAFTAIGDIPEAVCCPTTAARMPKAGKLRGLPAVELLSYAGDANVLKSSIAVALLNALSAHLWAGHEPHGYIIERRRDAIEEIDFRSFRSVVLVGAFTPFIRELKRQQASFLVLEKNPAALKQDELPLHRWPEQAGEVLPKADLIILTGTTIVNNTIDGLLAHVQPGTEVIIAGPTASMVPTAYFARGVTCLGGISIYEPDLLLDLLAEAGSAYHLFGTCAEKITLRPSEVTVR